jgi:PAS domain S-box-containing protein
MNYNELSLSLNNQQTKKSIANSEKLNKSPELGDSFFQAVNDSAGVGIVVFDEKGALVYVNYSFSKLTGRENSELVGEMPPYEFLSLSDTQILLNMFQVTLSNRKAGNMHELEFINRDGEVIPCQVTLSAFQVDYNKKFLQANIIPRPKGYMADDSVKKSHSLLMSVIESHKDILIFSTDREYRYLHFNQSYRDSMKFAYDREIEEGVSILDYITSEDERMLVKETIDLALNGQSSSFIQTFGNVNAAYYECFFNPISDENGEIIGCTVLARDITAAVKAERALRDSEIKFKEIIDQINDIIVVFDEKKKVIIWNKGAEQALGVKAEEALGKNIVDLQLRFTLPPRNNREEIEKTVNAIISREDPDVFTKILDNEIQIPDSGKLLNIQSVVFPVNLNGSYLFGYVIRDITEIKRFELELLRVSDEKDKFYSMIAQYLYTPFNVFNNFSKLMAEELDNLPIREIQKMAAMMSKSASNLYNLLDNLMQWIRLNQGKISYQPQNLNLKKTSKDAVSVLKPGAFSKNFRINHFIDDEINVFADNYMLKTILRNLVTSVIKFSDDDGQIDIIANQTATSTVISVLGETITLDPEYLTNLFDISQTHSNLGAAEEKGTVLGLLLCKELVDKHGGQISVENHNGTGTEFQFTIPAL